MTPETHLMLATISLQAEQTDVWSGWGSVILAVVIIAVAMVIAVILIWQIFRTIQTRMATEATISHNQAFRRIAEQVSASEATIAMETSRISAELQEIRGRLTAIERLLREVE